MGLYIHVPFCHSKCSYCAFYSVASVTLLEAWCDALCCEMEARSGEMLHETLYFGGGTPSILPEGILRRICESLRRNYRIAEGTECTIEVNPEDVTEERVALWRELGFNRVSIGVQSFSIEELAVASRRHSVEEALRAVECAKAGGFDNIGIDLILGLSDRSESAVAEVVKILRGLPITHISLYLLSIEEGSILYKRVSQGLFKPLDDDTEAGLYLKYCDAFRELGFEHYEISNFAKPSFRSRHNSSYWRQLPYLGFGPAAHSYDGARRRRWNLPSLRRYLDYWSPNGNSATPVASGDAPCFEEELLSDAELYNELIMTRLRTAEGLPLSILHERGFAEFWSAVESKAEEYISQGYAELRDGALILDERGWLISDAIFSDLFADTE